MPGNANPLNNPGAEHRSANATSRLEQLGFTIAEARDFIEENIEDLDFIYEVCLANGLTTDDIAVIMDIDDYDGQVISDYFGQFGIDTSTLDADDAYDATDDATDDADDATDDATDDADDATDDADDATDDADDDADDATDDADDATEDADDATDDADDDADNADDATDATDDADDATDDADDAIDNVDDGVYSGTISSDFFEFEGIFETTVAGDEINGTWSIEELDLSGILYGTVDNEDGTYNLDDEVFDLTITGVITDDYSTGTWTSGSFTGNVETTLFIG